MNTIEINKYITSPLQIRLGKEYFKNGYVFYQEKIDQRYISKIGILSNVYECSFEKNEKELVKIKCSCGKEGCSHVAASLFAWQQEEYKSPISYRGEEMIRIRKQELRIQKFKERAMKSNLLIFQTKDKYQTSVQGQVQSAKYSLVPTIEYVDNELSVSYKIGLDKYYVLKNIEDFLNAINNEANIKYGKNLQFIHKPEAFDEDARSQIEFMREVNRINSQRVIENRDYYYSRESFALRKSISIDNRNIDVFCDYYNNISIENFAIEEWEYKIPLELSEEQGFYVVKVQLPENLIFSQFGLYQISIDNFKITLKRMMLDNNGTLFNFINNLENKEYILSKDDYSDFYKYVISPNTKYFDCKHFIDQNNEYNLIKIYGDVTDNGEVVFSLYYYDDNMNRIKGFNTNIVTTFEQDVVENYIRKSASHIDEETKIAYFDLESEDTYHFVDEGLEFLKEYAEVYVSEALKRIGKKTKYNITVGIGFSNDLLQVNIQSDEIPKNELSNVLSQYKKKKKFYRLKSGKLLYLESDALEELENFMDEYHISPKDMEKGKFTLSRQRMFSLNQDSDEGHFITFKRDETFKKALKKFDEMKDKDISIPKKYERVLRDYQKDGFKWMRTLQNYGFNGILADDMGLGKTLQVISLLESLEDEKPSIVICPASLIYNWEDEVRKFSCDLDVKCIVGNKENRKEIIQKLDHQLYITSYDYVRRDIDLFEGKEFNYCILDEAQNIKNQKTKNAISVKQIQSKHRLALTGTPIENTLAELWSIFDFLMPEYLFNYSYFQKEYETNIVKNSDEKSVQKLRKLVSPFILRRNKKEVLTELPDKIEQVHYVSFSEKEKELYFANLAQMNEDLQTLLSVEKNSNIQVLALLTKLRQICLEPRMIYENIENPSSKIKETLKLVRSLKDNNQKVLIFSSFTSVFDYLIEEFKMEGVQYHLLTGSTLKEDRRDMVKEFQEDDSDVFLISLKAGGTGLNLTSAQAVIHLDPWWNISAQNQATDRAYRIGQKQNVQVYNMVVKGSIEEKILKLQEMKKELADTFVEGNHGSISTMSKEEIQDLFTFTE